MSAFEHRFGDRPSDQLSKICRQSAPAFTCAAKCCAVVSTNRSEQAHRHRPGAHRRPAGLDPYHRHGPAACTSPPSTARRRNRSARYPSAIWPLDPFHRFIYRRQSLHRFRADHRSVQLSSAINGSSRGPSPSTNQTFCPKRVRHHQDVREQNRCIERKAPQGLHHRLCRQGRGVAEIQEALRAGPKLPILGQIAPGLTHDPNRRRIDPLSVQDTQESGKALPIGHCFPSKLKF